MLAAEHGRGERSSGGRGSRIVRFLTSRLAPAADVVELLIELGADCTLKNKLNHNATELADWFGHKRAVELLFEATAGGTRAGSAGTTA